MQKNPHISAWILTKRLNLFKKKMCLTMQFEIVWCSDRGGDGKIENLKIPNQARYDAPTVNGVGVYKRIFIKKVSA